MGNASYRQTTGNIQQDQRNYFPIDLPKFILQSKIGDSKFLKTYIFRVDGVSVIVKVYMKLYEEDLKIPAEQLSTISATLSTSKYPNLLPYQMWIKSNSVRFNKSIASPVYLIRQYFKSNLYDRLSTRPFFNEMEKLWIIYQLFKCLEICHDHKIIHGDIKPENIMCTTANWVILTDFSPFKPSLIPDDDPTDFKYYFDCSGHNRCYVAPERFIRNEIKPKLGNTRKASFVSTTSPLAPLTPAMDVFSLGCVMAEIFLDGVPLLDLPGMLKYVNQPMTRLDHEESPARSLLLRIKNIHIRNVIIDMTQKDPTSRLSISEYLNILQTKSPLPSPNSSFSSSLPSLNVLPPSAPLETNHPPSTSTSSSSSSSSSSSLPSCGNIEGYFGFPPYFNSFLYKLYLNLHWNGITPDDRINIICQNYESLTREVMGVEDEEGRKFFQCAMVGHRLFTAATAVKEAVAVMLPADPSISSSSTPAKSSSSSNLNIHPETASALLLYSSRMRIAKEKSFTKPLVNSNESSFDDNSFYNATGSNSAIDQLALRSEQLIEEMKEYYDSYCDEVKNVSSSSPVGIANTAATNMHSIMESTADSNVLGCISSYSFANAQDKGSNITSSRPIHEGLVVVIDILYANFRHLKYPQSKIVSLVLLLRIGRYCNDTIILQRALPLLLLGLDDLSANVRAISVRVLKSLLMLVEHISSVESNIFPLYLFQPLTRIAKDSESIVRIAFAECIGGFSEISKRFLDISHIIELRKSIATMAESSSSDQLLPILPSSFQFPYDQKLDVLRDQVGRWIRDLIVEGVGSSSNNASNTVSSANHHRASNNNSSASNVINPSYDQLRKASLVKRMFLKDVIRLFVFFGQENTMDKLLTQLLTFLNDPDWELRHAFCAQIPSMCAFLGPTVTSECILPCIENTIYDVEERVILCALHSLTVLVQSQLLTNHLIIDFVTKCKSLLIHPSDSLRSAAIQFTSIAAKHIGDVESVVFISPILRDILKYDFMDKQLNKSFLESALISKLSRRTYRHALITTLNNITSHSNQQSRQNNSNKLSYKPLVDEEFFKELQQNDNDTKQLEIIQKYIELAAREINTKTMQWRNSDASQSGAASLNSSIRVEAFVLDEFSRRVSMNNTMVVSDLALFAIPEHMIQSVYIPHQKFGSLISKPLSEDVRKSDILVNNDGSRNLLLLRVLFGIVLKPNETSVQNVITNLYGLNDNLNSNTVAVNSEIVKLESNKQQQQTLISSYNYSNPFYIESLGLLKRIKALEIPSIPPDTGYLTQPTSENKIYNSYIEKLDTAYCLDQQQSRTSAWRPKEGVLLASAREHTDAVNRIVVCPDQSYFASGSADGSVKIWQTRYLDKISFPKSVVTYQQHKSPILDLTHLENSHSIASASVDGTIHIWRVDMATKSSSTSLQSNTTGTGYDSSSYLYDEYTTQGNSLTVSGLSQVRMLNPAEGAILNVAHFNSDVASLVTYATQRGGLHAWDLRAAKEAFCFPIRPELGYSTSMTIAPDRNWICVGSSKGFISLFDIRYNVPCKLWRHSSNSAIHYIDSYKSQHRSGSSSSNSGFATPSDHGFATPQSDGAFLVVAAGDNEAAVWGIPEGGECCKCFRSVSLDSSRAPISKLPVLYDIPLSRHPSAHIHPQYTQQQQQQAVVSSIDNISLIGSSRQQKSFSIRSLLGRISPHTNMSYLITAGTDRAIRFWDFSSPTRCYTVSGLEAAQPKALFDAPKLNDGSTGKLFVCYVAASPSIDKILQSQLPAKEGRGVLMPSVNTKDAILDIKKLDFPLSAIISGSKDGEIKLWR